eukprot:1297496-Prymnesium_polylepis.1
MASQDVSLLENGNSQAAELMRQLSELRAAQQAALRRNTVLENRVQVEAAFAGRSNNGLPHASAVTLQRTARKAAIIRRFRRCIRSARFIQRCARRRLGFKARAAIKIQAALLRFAQCKDFCILVQSAQLVQRVFRAYIYGLHLRSKTSFKREVIELKEELKKTRKTLATAREWVDRTVDGMGLKVQQHRLLHHSMGKRAKTESASKLLAVFGDDGAVAAPNAAIAAWITVLAAHVSGPPKSEALELLSHFSCGDDMDAEERRENVAAAGGIEALVDAMKDSGMTSEQYGEVCRALQSIASGVGILSENRCDRIVQAGGVEALISLLTDSGVDTCDDLKIAAVKTLRNLSHDDSGAGQARRKRIIAASGVTVLRHVINDPTASSPAKCGAAQALLNLDADSADDDSAPRADSPAAVATSNPVVE